METGSVDKNEKESEPLETSPDSDTPKNQVAEPPCSDDDGSQRTVSSIDLNSKSTPTTSVVDGKSPRINAQKSSSSQSNLVKSLANDVKEMKDRIRKLEDEVSTLHELLKVQDDITAETLAILPNTFKNSDKNSWKKHSNPPSDFRGKSNYHKQDYHKHEFHKQDHHKQEYHKQEFHKPDYRKQDSRKQDYYTHDKNSGSMDSNPSQAMMMNNHAWYGDAFLFELMCQVKGYHPKEDNWFSSIYPFVAFEAFCKRMFDRKHFYRTIVFSIGYSDLFNAKAVTGFPMKQALHALLNKMHERGAQHIKVLSVPPARQMMKNVEYLKICQTTNKFLKAITKTHTFVDFINLDKFFINNPNEFFNYIDGNNDVQVQINDHMLMRKVNDHFEIFIDPDTAKEVIDYIVDFPPSVKGYQTSSSSNGTFSNKRRPESSLSPNYPTKRMHVSRLDDDYDDPSYRPDNCDRRYSDYAEGSRGDEYENYDYRRQRSSSRSERNSPPPWLKQ